MILALIGSILLVASAGSSFLLGVAFGAGFVVFGLLLTFTSSRYS